MVNIDMEIAKWIALLWAQRSGVTISSRNYQLRVLIVTELLRCYDDNIWNNVFVISYNYNFLQEFFFSTVSQKYFFVTNEARVLYIL